MNIDYIPAKLKAIPRWLVWKLEERAGKSTKVPYQADGRPAKVNDPATWTSYESALSAYQGGGFSGLGIVLTDSDELVGIDLDNCLNPDTGELNDEAAAIVAMLPTYCEVSPSGRGLRLFGFGTLPPGGRRKGAVEIYSAGRYLTVTGDRFNGYTALANITPQLAEVHARILESPPSQSPWPPRPGPPFRPTWTTRRYSTRPAAPATAATSLVCGVGTLPRTAATIRRPIWRYAITWLFGREMTPIALIGCFASPV